MFHLCQCVVRKADEYVYKKALNMRHQSQKSFRGILVGIPQHQKGYLIYVPSTRKMVSSHAVIFDKKVSNALAYTSCLYSEALSTKPKLPCILYDTSSHEKTGDIITFAHFEEFFSGK